MSEDRFDLAERLVQARKLKFKEASEAARAMGIPEPTYLGHENGSRGYRANASRYADFFGVNLEWLLTGRGTMRKGGAAPKPNAIRPEQAQPLDPAISRQEMRRDVPVEGIAMCGPDGRFAFERGTIDYVRRPPRLAGIADAYALYTGGSSMSPWREELQLVYVLPSAPIQVGDHVVVQVREDEHPAGAYIKKLIGRTSRELKLLQYNPREEIRISLKAVVHIHKIIEWSELLGI